MYIANCNLFNRTTSIRFGLGLSSNRITDLSFQILHLFLRHHLRLYKHLLQLWVTPFQEVVLEQKQH